jgi:hypothetical protein
MFHITYNAPLTDKLLVEAGVAYLQSGIQLGRQPEDPGNLYQVTELSRNLVYRSRGRNDIYWPNVNSRAKLSYVTGSHVFSVGMQTLTGYARSTTTVVNDTTLQFLNGVPTRVTVFTTPSTTRNNVNLELGLFAQEQWRLRGLTLNGGVRFDHVHSSVAEQHLPPVRFIGARDYPAIDNVPNWYDLSPRLGAAYDLFGNGKTAVKASLNRYGKSEIGSIAAISNPISASVNSTTRPWTDSNGDFIPQENELGALANPNFGKLNVVTTYDPDYLTGWNKRGYNWVVLAGVQHELRPGWAVTANYVRRWYGNFLASDIPGRAPSDYSPFCVQVPVDSRLPGGGGNQLCGFYDVNENKRAEVLTVVGRADKFGKITDVYNGFDLGLKVRLPQGINLQGGTSTGHEVTDTCDVSGKVDNAPGPLSPQFDVGALTVQTGANPSGLASPSKLFCRSQPPFQTDLRFLAVYPLPWWGISTSAIFQSLPGAELFAPYTVSNALVAPTLGRNLSGGATVTTVQLLGGGTLYDDRVNQLDLRVAKNFKMGRVRVQALVDIFNVLNSSAVLRANNTYGPSWLFASAIMPARFVKLGAQLDF